MSSATSAVALSTATLRGLGPAISVPTYDRQRLTPSIVHIGVGGFHRAHFATYVHELCEQGNHDWSITGAGVLAGDQRMADALAAQDHLYALIERGPQTSVSVIGSITGFVLADRTPGPLLERIADPQTQIVSLTVTEAGYPIDEETGRFLPQSPMAGPGSAFGALAAGLALRRERGLGPVSVLSFDNIIGNGDVTRAATLGEAASLSPTLADWIARHVAFPNGMVDRITPATTPEHREWLVDSHGLQDRWPVVAEPFRQWVLEDTFAAGRPPLEDLDVIVTSDVAPYEAMKLRLLNAGHSCLAYLAALDGAETVDEAMGVPPLRDFVRSLLDLEARPTLAPVQGVDTDEYVSSLIDRFANPYLGDQVSRLCLDGSAKMASFLMPTVRAQLVRGGPVELSALAVAGWCEYLFRRSSPGSAAAPAADASLEAAVGHARASSADPAAFLGYEEVFGTDVARSDRFREAFVDALTGLRDDGIRSAITSTLSGMEERR